MIQYRAIRKAMVEALAVYLAAPVVEMNSIGKEPPYPYVTYDFINPAGDPIGFPAVTIEENIMQHTENVSFTVSFQSYADDKADSIEQAMKLRDWFMVEGRWLLKDNVNVVVTHIGGIENRDIQLGDEWERRNGLDIEFRTLNIVKEALRTIDTATIKGAERIG
ncbi:LIC_12616 family protein [Paenibacillus sepulcri]|uniref:Phage neck terminator protein gp12-like domain-containing protein n=1 Tax=Paenibacillus sepulcri TaxID=359917 RepID=A0ABS7BUW5_9BACL|nr:hypothetical protein [Paenibacillus sepulcri]